MNRQGLTGPLLAQQGASMAVVYEETRLKLGRHLSRTAVRRLLTDRAEYGGWELRRLRRYPDGSREVWIRRKIIKAMPTLMPSSSSLSRE